MLLQILRTKSLLLSLMTSLLLAGVSLAQDTTGTITGTVTDAQHARSLPSTRRQRHAQ